MTMPVLCLSLLLAVLPAQSSFAVIGSVRDNGGQRVSAIRISLLDENYHSIQTVFVDSSGRFQFRGLRQGVYLVRVEPAGTPYEEQVQRVEFQSLSGRSTGGEEPFILDFVLKRKPSATAALPREVVFSQTVPEAARLAYEEGTALLKEEKVEPAIEAVKRALELFPDYFLALETLGSEYVKRGQFNEALPVLGHAVEVNRHAPKSLYALGVAYLKLNQLKEATEWLKKAATADGTNPNVYVMLGQAYGNNREYEEAATALKQALALGGAQAADVRFYLASVYNKQGKYAEAIRELELYLKEGKEIDRAKIKAAIESLKAKEKAKK